MYSHSLGQNECKLHEYNTYFGLRNTCVATFWVDGWRGCNDIQFAEFCALHWLSTLHNTHTYSIEGGVSRRGRWIIAQLGGLICSGGWISSSAWVD